MKTGYGRSLVTFPQAVSRVRSQHDSWPTSFGRSFKRRLNARALGELIAEIGRRIEPFGNVARMSMQCVRIDVPSGMMHIANAGHPFPARAHKEPRVDR